MPSLLGLFFDRFARLAPALLVPELRLWSAQDLTAFWEACQAATSNPTLELPYWAVVWPGGAGLARYLLDHPDMFEGKKVLDLAAGSGIVALAAARVGAISTANDIDPDALELCRLASQINGLQITDLPGDLLDRDPPSWFHVILAGDVFYEQRLAERCMRWMRMAARAGLSCLVADAGRRYRPQVGLTPLASYTVPTLPEVETTAAKEVTVYEIGR
ncbi:MAG: methyltransferase [Bradymonadales bacterium]|nr:methyltransferase [Bradymonadales bacterium]